MKADILSLAHSSPQDIQETDYNQLYQSNGLLCGSMEDQDKQHPQQRLFVSYYNIRQQKRRLLEYGMTSQE